MRPACTAATLLLAACSAGDPAIQWTGTVTDSAGVMIVQNPEKGIWRESEGWTLEEEIRIGSFGGDPLYQFGQVGTVAVDSKGEIFVSDIQAQDVRVYSANGTYLRTVGGPGSGPGELGHAASVLLIAPGDTLLVPDPRNRRINRFDPEGASLGSVPLHPERERLLRYNLNAVGAMTAQARPVQTGDPQGVAPMDAILVIESSGAFGDTLLKVPTGGLFRGEGIHYFTPEPWWDISDSLTVLYGVNSEHRIGFFDRRGTLKRIVSKPTAPTPITDRDIRAFFAYLDRAWLDAGVPPSRLPANHARVHFAEVFPAFARFDTGYQGTLWVQPVRSPGGMSDEEIERYNFTEDFGSTAWEVFDREGRYLGIVDMPARFQPRMFLENKVYGVWRDELDVQYVLRLRIVDD